jgi:hypothetical protein
MDTTKKLTLLEAIEDQLTAPTAAYSVYLDGAAWSRGKRLRERIVEARRLEDSLKSDVPKLQAALDQVQAQIQESELTFTFEALPKTVYTTVLDNCQSTDPRMAWDPETFPPALIAAACTGLSGVYEADGLTLEDVVGLWERLGDAQTEGLFRCAYGLQVEAPKPFTPAATGPTTGSGPNSTTAANTEYPTQSS